MQQRRNKRIRMTSKLNLASRELIKLEEKQVPEGKNTLTEFSLIVHLQTKMTFGSALSPMTSH